MRGAEGLTLSWRLAAGMCAPLLLSVVACGGGGGESDDTVVSTSVGDNGSGVAGGSDDDERDDVLAEIGVPDAFVIQVGEVDGEAARLESWTYFDASTQIDFLDGEVLWDIEIEPVEDGALLPLLYSPAEFDLLASKSDTLALLEGVQLDEIDGSELELEGAEILAGEQLLLAFVDDLLVYAESYVLAPGEQEVE